MVLHVLPLVLALTGQGAPPQQAPPPPPPTQVQRPATPRKVFNETADAKVQIATALKGAAEDDLRVLLIWGANDCERCTQLYGPLFGGTPGTDTYEALRVMQGNEYKMVNVDVGHLDRNQDVAQAYHVTLTAAALPYVTVLDKAGKVLAHESAQQFAGEGAVAYEPKKILAFLKKYQVTPVDSQPLFAAALQRAKAENKEVFLWFSAPW